MCAEREARRSQSPGVDVLGNRHALSPQAWGRRGGWAAPLGQKKQKQSLTESSAPPDLAGLRHQS